MQAAGRDFNLPNDVGMYVATSWCDAKNSTFMKNYLSTVAFIIFLSTISTTVRAVNRQDKTLTSPAIDCPKLLMAKAFDLVSPKQRGPILLHGTTLQGLQYWANQNSIPGADPRRYKTITDHLTGIGSRDVFYFFKTERLTDEVTEYPRHYTRIYGPPHFMLSALGGA